MSRRFIHEKSCCVSLGVFPSLNGSIFAVNIVVRKSDNPGRWVGKVHEEGESILSLSINFKKRRESIWNGHRGKTIPENEKDRESRQHNDLQDVRTFSFVERRDEIQP